MMALLTVLIPGLAQLLTGNARKAATMFVVAAVAGSLTAGVGWLIAGLWSLTDSRSAAFTPAPAVAPAGSSAPGREKAALVQWVFKFALLGGGFAIALYSISQGRALQSLKFLGVEMSFESSLGDRTADASVPGNAGAAEGRTAEAPVNALQPVSREMRSSSSGSEAASPHPVDLSGSWSSAEGATYQIAQTGNAVQIREISRLFYIPIETAVCQGIVDHGSITAQCSTYSGTGGHLQLVADRSGRSMSGMYRDYSGGQIGLVLTR